MSELNKFIKNILGFDSSTAKEKGLHVCEIQTEYEIYGNAIEICQEDIQGNLWVYNSEYASKVNYCPNCGFTKIGIKK